MKNDDFFNFLVNIKNSNINKFIFVLERLQFCVREKNIPHNYE
jgi:hypothetical protein